MKVKFFSAVLSAMILAFSGIGATTFAEETTETATSADAETTKISETAKVAETTISSDAESEIAENTSILTKKLQVKFSIITAMINQKELFLIPKKYSLLLSLQRTDTFSMC